jgi:rare lipoprotein A
LRKLFVLGFLLMATPSYAYNTVATFYGHGEHLSSFTASGQRFNPGAMACAHRKFPFGTKLKVTYKGRSVVVVVNDRGPFSGAGIDLTYGAARRLGMLSTGSVNIEKIN